MIELEKVTRTYGQGPATVYALREVTTSIEEGSFVTIVGASGSGKSTLLNLVGALDRPTSGRITIDHAELFKLSDYARTLFRR
jgi:putative ABC transport system ATP-binding protein